MEFKHDGRAVAFTEARQGRERRDREPFEKRLYLVEDDYVAGETV